MSKLSTIQQSSSNIDSVRTGLTEVSNRQGYKLLHTSRTISKSVQSKIKNLAYTLSAPFRAVMRQIIQSRAGHSTNAAGVINIKSTTPPRTAPAENKMEPQSRPGADYEVVEISEGYGRQSLLGRIWG